MGHSLSQWVYFGGVKAFADGSLGSNSALFYEVRSTFNFFDIQYLLMNKNLNALLMIPSSNNVKRESRKIAVCSNSAMLQLHYSL
jgi:predicted amidohydrolase YtcJ